METLPSYLVLLQEWDLHMAVSANNILEVQRLLAGGADVNFCAAGFCSPAPLALARENDLAFLLLELEDDLYPNLGNPSDSVSPLHVSVYHDNVEVVKMLLDCGANANGKMILIAIKNDNLDILKLLLKNGADPNYKENLPDSPLHFALKYSYSVDGPINIVKALIEAGADVNAANLMGQTALHLAKCPDIVMYLLENGAQINAQDNEGRTPLHLTIISITEIHEKKNVIEPLLFYGADVDIPDVYGQTFVKMCTEINILLSSDIDVTMTKFRMLKIKSHLTKRFYVTTRESEHLIAELDRIKKTNVEGICLYNAFGQSLEDFVFYNDSTFRKIFQGHDFRKNFPHFYLLMRLFFREAERKYVLRELSETFSYKLSEVLQLNVPTDVGYLVIGLLYERDMNNLKLALQ